MGQEKTTKTQFSRLIKIISAEIELPRPKSEVERLEKLRKTLSAAESDLTKVRIAALKRAKSSS